MAGVGCSRFSRVDVEVAGLRTHRRLGVVVASVAATVLLIGWQPVGAQENPVSLDPDKGTKDGSPVEHLPPHIQLLDIRLPDGGQPMRPDWSPDGRRLALLDAPLGDVWEHDLLGGANRNLTGAFLPGGVLRAHHMSNGDLLLCAPAKRSVEDSDGDRFRGQLWVLQRPLGTRAPVPLGEKCWEGIAASKHPDSTRIAWNHSTIDFTDFPNVFVEALIGESQVLTGRIVYGDDGTSTIVDRTVVLDKRDVSPDTPAVEAQDFRSLDDGDAVPDDELIFTAYFHNGGQAMGLDLDTGEITDYAPMSVFYEEAEGADPAGRYVLVEREQTVTLFPGMLDIWRLSLNGSGTFERLTTFSHYRGYGAKNPVASPDGRFIAFSLKVEGEEGEGDGILLLDQRPPAADPSSSLTPDPAAPGTPPGSAEANGARLAATGPASALAAVGAAMAVAALLARRMLLVGTAGARRSSAQRRNQGRR